MDRRLVVLVAVLAGSMAPGAIRQARADRLGGNYRGPGDVCTVREDRPPTAGTLAHQDPLLASLGLELPFRTGLEKARREAEFRGRPLLVFFVLPGSDLCSAVADRAFRDVEVLDLAARFIPLVVDTEKEEAFGIAHGVRVIPSILVLDSTGREVVRGEGLVDARRAAALFRDGLKRTGSARPTPPAQALERKAALLARAQEAKNWRSVLETSAAIEKAGHEGPELEAARAARELAAIEAATALDEARSLVRRGASADARIILARIARDFAGLRESGEAMDILGGLTGKRAATRGPAGAVPPPEGVKPGSSDWGLPSPTVDPSLFPLIKPLMDPKEPDPPPEPGP